MLPEAVVAPLQEHLQRVKRLHERALAQGYGSVYLPFALGHKYPNAGPEWIWQYVFPSGWLSVDPRSGVVRRHHLDESGLQKAVWAAAQAAGIPKKVGCHRSTLTSSIAAGWPSAVRWISRNREEPARPLHVGPVFFPKRLKHHLFFARGAGYKSSD